MRSNDTGTAVGPTPWSTASDGPGHGVGDAGLGEHCAGSAPELFGVSCVERHVEPPLTTPGRRLRSEPVE